MEAKRRNNGEGSFRQDASGRWHAWVQLPGGRRVHRSAKTKTEVKRKLREVQGARDRGLPVPDQRLTVEAYLTTWLANVVKDKRRSRTYQGYESHVRVHIAPSIGKIVLAQLSVSDVERMLATLKGRNGRPLAPRTVQRVRDTLRNALSKAEAREMVARNVAKLAEPPTVEHKQVRAIGVAEAEAILAAVAGHRLAPFFEFALYTGLRLGELAGLRWTEDVDLEAGTLKLGEQLHRLLKQGFVRGNLKNGKSARELRLPPFAVDVLRRQRALQAQERLMAGGEWQDRDGLVFTTSRGGPVGHGVTRTLQSLVKKAGLPPCRTHDLRHACATILLAHGESPHVVQHQLGHSDIRLTLGTYAHVTADMAASAAATMQDAFTKGNARRSAS